MNPGPPLFSLFLGERGRHLRCRTARKPRSGWEPSFTAHSAPEVPPTFTPDEKLFLGRAVEDSQGRQPLDSDLLGEEPCRGGTSRKDQGFTGTRPRNAPSAHSSQRGQVGRVFVNTQSGRYSTTLTTSSNAVIFQVAISSSAILKS